MNKLSIQDRILVLGSNGMVGGSVLRSLYLKGISPIPEERIDLRDFEQTIEMLKKLNPDIVIFCAAKVGGMIINDKLPFTFFVDNVKMAYNIIYGCYLNDIYRLVYLGSSCIYPKNCPQPIKESYLLTSALEPTNEGYALAKISGVKMIQWLKKEFDLDDRYQYISVMPCNLLGINDNYNSEGSHVIPSIIRKIYNARITGSDEISFMGNGKSLREFLDADDLAEAIIFLLENYADSDPINIGSDDEFTISDLVSVISQEIGYLGEIKWLDDGRDGVKRKKLDISKITNLGWKPERNLNLSIKIVIDDFLYRLESGILRN